MKHFKPGDRVYYDDNPLTIVAGPYALMAAWQYAVQTVDGKTVWSWASDLLSEAEYRAMCGEGEQ
jgi:hypothetical protein